MITNEMYFFKNQSTIDMSNSLYNVNDGTLILQVDGEASELELSVLGNTDLTNDDFISLKVINASNYTVSSNITSNGIYWIDINGIRKIKLNLTNITGTLTVKGMTKSGLTTDLVARAMAANSQGGGCSLEEVEAITGKLNNLNTEDKSNLVNAINEVFDSGSLIELDIDTDMTTKTVGLYLVTNNNIKLSIGATKGLTSSTFYQNDFVFWNGIDSIFSFGKSSGIPILKTYRCDSASIGRESTVAIPNILDSTSNQTIIGEKTFTTLPKCSTSPSNDNQLANKKYVDDNKYTLPIASADTLGGIKIGENLTVDENGVVSASGGGEKIYYYEYYASYNYSDTSEASLAMFNEIREKLENGEHPMIIVHRHQFDSSKYWGSDIRVLCTPILYPTWNSEYMYIKSAPIYSTQSGGIDMYLNVYLTCARDSSTGLITSIKETKTYDTRYLVESYQKGKNERASSKNLVLTTTNTESYTPTSDYNPSTKLYTDKTHYENMAGYDASKTQVLKNINGTLTWVSE